MHFTAHSILPEGYPADGLSNLITRLGGQLTCSGLDALTANRSSRTTEDEASEPHWFDLLIVPLDLEAGLVKKIVRRVRQDPSLQAMGLVGLEMQGSDNAVVSALLTGFDQVHRLPIDTSGQWQSIQVALTSLAQVARLDRRTAKLGQIASSIQMTTEFGFGQNVPVLAPETNQDDLSARPFVALPVNPSAEDCAHALSQANRRECTVEIAWSNKLVAQARLRSVQARGRWRQDCGSRMQSTLDQALRDPLSNLFNRKHLETTLPQMMQTARQNGQSMGMVGLDMNGFKQVNDTYGHPTGDALIRALGQNIGQMTRLGDFAARVGGDEFVVLLPNVDLAELEAIKGRVAQQVETTQIKAPDGTFIGAGVSLGSLLFSADDWRSTPPLLLAQLDQALYEAKRAHYRQQKKER